jgi:hypothetical protein
MPGEVQPPDPASESPSSSALKPTAGNRKPRRSNFSPCTRSVSRSHAEPSRMPTMPIGTLSVKITRQSTYSTR